MSILLSSQRSFPPPTGREEFFLRSVNRRSPGDEITILPKTKRGRHDDESENEDRLSDLPDCVLLHILSFVHAKHAVRTCILSTRWKHLWKHIPTLTLHSSLTYHDFSTLKSFDKFVSRIFSLRDGSVALQALDLKRHGSIEPHNLRKVVNYVVSCSAQLQRLEISVHGDSCLILPCISSCRALTSLKLSIYPKGRYTSGETLFPKSLNLPALTTLHLTNFAFWASDNGDRAEPFSAFNNLNSLIICSCTVRDAQILSISSATLVNLTMDINSSDFTKIELSAPSLCTLTFTGSPDQKLCGSSLSSVKHVNIDVYVLSPWGEPPLVLLSWLLDLPNITSLTVTANTLLVLSLVPDVLKFKLPSLCNLKSLKVKLEPLSFVASSLLEAVMLKNKSRKEASKIKKTFKAGVEPSATIPGRIVDFLLQNSPSAEVDIIDDKNSRKLMLNDTSPNEDMDAKSQPNTHSLALDNGL